MLISTPSPSLREGWRAVSVGSEAPTSGSLSLRSVAAGLGADAPASYVRCVLLLSAPVCKHPVQCSQPAPSRRGLSAKRKNRIHETITDAEAKMKCNTAEKRKMQRGWCLCLSAYLTTPVGLVFVGRLWVRASRFTHHTPCAALMVGAGRYGGNAAPCTPFHGGWCLSAPPARAGGWTQLTPPQVGEGLRPRLPVRRHTVGVLASHREYQSR